MKRLSENQHNEILNFIQSKFSSNGEELTYDDIEEHLVPAFEDLYESRN